MLKVMPSKGLHILQPTQGGEGHWEEACKCSRDLEDHQVHRDIQGHDASTTDGYEVQEVIAEVLQGQVQEVRRRIPHNHNLPTLMVPIYNGLEHT